MTKRRQTRRDFLKTTGAIAALGIAGLSGEAAEAAAKACSGNSKKPGRTKGACARPNILFLLVDEMRYPPVYEAAGLKQFRRTYLQTQKALRETGVEFHRHYAASTACAPSRASIFTGHYPSLHGVTQTTGAAKEANDPDVFWLGPSSVPTMGDYFLAAGYRSFYRGKWHVSDADLQVPGTHEQIVSYTDTGKRDPAKEALYQQANQLAGYGFDGWIGPEPHGANPLNSGSSPEAPKTGRDAGFAAQTVELIEQLDRSKDNSPWFLVSSFVNPHDITLWGFVAQHFGSFNLAVEDVVPDFEDLFDGAQFLRTLTDDLSTKPSCQLSYRDSYEEWMQGIPPNDYFRFYYQLHKNVDAEMLKVYQALEASRFFENTVVVFTSDHGDLLGSHRYMHQKWYQAYDEALRVPLIISGAGRTMQGESVTSLTSHVDLLPTLLGIAGLDAADYLAEVAVGHSDAVLPVGRNLAGLVTGALPSVDDPIYFMTDDDPSRGLNQVNFYGIAYDSVTQPNHIESVLATIDGDLYKYSRYFDNEQFWSDTEPQSGQRHDVVLTIEEGPDLPGEYAVPATKRVKYQPEGEEYEMYNLTADPLELHNLAHDPLFLARRVMLAAMLDEQREQKRLRPISGEVPGQP